AASASQPRTACWWQCGWATAARGPEISDMSGGGPPSVDRSSSPQVRTPPATGPPPTVARQQPPRVAAQRRRTGRLEADDRDPGVEGRLQRAQRPVELAARAVELPGRDPGQAAADVLARDPDLVPGGFEHRDRRLTDLR